MNVATVVGIMSRKPVRRPGSTFRGSARVGALGTARAFWRRELRVARSSRVAYLAPLGGIAAGVAAALGSGGGDASVAAPLFLLQVLMYALPLACCLIATSAAQADAGEGLLLASLPLGGLAWALGKFLGLLCPFALAVAAAVALPVGFGMRIGDACLLFGYGIGTASLFLSLGLLVGFAARDAAKAQLATLAMWLALTLGASGVGYLLLPFASAQPGAWVALLMASPLDALRVGVLFSVQPAPFDASAAPALARWWLENPGVWFAMLASTLVGGALFVAGRFARRGRAC